MIQPRKVAAIDIALLGRPLIVAEFAIGVLAGIALGTFILFRARSPMQLAIGLYIITLGLNYVPMLLHGSLSKIASAPVPKSAMNSATNGRPWLNTAASPCACLSRS